MKLEFHWLGLISYEQALQRQLQAWEQTSEDGVVRILGCEHEAVITLGKRGDEGADIHKSLEFMPPIVHVDRGGQATLHSPGQLVVYPIFPLRSSHMGVREFVDFLLEVTAIFLSRYHIRTFQQVGHPGLFTDSGKIAFCGLRIDRGVSRHGISINIKNSLEMFSVIRPCGLNDSFLDRVSSHGEFDLEMNLCFQQWCEDFREGLVLKGSP